MRFIVIPGVCLAIFFGLQHTIGTLGAAGLSTLLFVGWFVFNVRAATTGLVKACMRSYFIQRDRGVGAEEALDGVIQARYRFSKDKQRKVRTMFEDMLNESTLSGWSERFIWDLSQLAVTDDEIKKGKNVEPIKLLTYVVFCHDNGTPPPGTTTKIISQINQVYALMRAQYRCE
ncbi:MAG TPA: hypothetical protein VIL61_00680 [Nitrospiria bacterium]